MAKNFTELKQALADWLNADNETRYPDAVRGDHVNMAMRRIMKKYRLRFGEIKDTFPTVVGTYDYDMPDRFVSFDKKGVWYANSDGDVVVLNYKTPSEFAALYPTPTVAADYANPTDYTFWGATITLGPTPDEVVTVNTRFYQYLADLATGNLTNVFTDEDWEPLFWEALKLACKFMKEPDRILEFQQEASESLMALVQSHTKARSHAGKAISNIPGQRYGGR